jgi:transposase
VRDLPLLKSSPLIYTDRLNELDRKIARRVKEDEIAHRLMSIPGIGRMAATAMVAIAPNAKSFARGCDFTARLGLTPRLGLISTMGERSLRCLLIIEASAVLRWAVRGKIRQVLG